MSTIFVTFILHIPTDLENHLTPDFQKCFGSVVFTVIAECDTTLK